MILNLFLNLGYFEELCGQIAHMVEVKLGAGLGEVIAQLGKGLLLMIKFVALGIGVIKSFSEDEVYIAWKTFGVKLC